MGLENQFNNTTSSKLGYSYKYSYNLMYDEGKIYQEHIDNFLYFSQNSETNIETN